MKPIYSPKYTGRLLQPAAIVALALLAMLGLVTREVSAESSYTWNGGSGSTGNWTDTANWGGASMVPQAFVNFDGSTRLSNTNNFSGGTAAHQIYFKSTGGAFNLYGSSLTFFDFGTVDPNIQNEGTSPTQTINFPVANGNNNGTFHILNINLNTGTSQGPLTFNGTVSSADSGQALRVINLYGPSALAFNGIISDFDSTHKLALSQLGSGTTTLTASNTFTGDMTVNAGTLVLATNSALANSTNFVRLGDTAGSTGANLNLNGGNNLSTSINVRSGSSGGKIIANTAGTLGGASFAGNLYLDGDATLFANSSGSNVLSGSTLDLKNQTLTLDGTGTNLISGSLTNSTGSGKLVKNNTGLLTLSGANTFTGGTTINAGTVSIAANNNLGANTNGVAFNGGTLKVTAAILGTAYTHTNTIGASGGTLQIAAGAGGQFVLNLVGLLTGSGPLNISGSGSLIDYANTGANFQGNISIINVANAGYTGVITVTNGGSVELNGGSTAAPYYVLASQGELILDATPAFSTPIVANGGVLDFNASVATSANITNNTGLTVMMRQFWNSTATYDSGTISGIISGAGGLTVGGANSAGGTLTLSGANTFVGGITLNTGNTININNTNALGTGAFTVGGNGTFDNTSGGAITNANNNALTMSGGSPTFTGTTNLNFGTGTVTVSGANRTLTVNANTLTLGGGVTDAGGSRKLTKAGAGTLVLNGAAGTWTGGSSIDAGTLIVGNDTALGTGTNALNGGTLAAGSGPRTLGNAILLMANSTIGGANNLTLNGIFTNSGGSRTLTVLNTGTTTLAGGVLLSDDNATAGRVLTISNVGPVIISGSISNNTAGNTVAASLTYLGTNTLTLSGSNNFTGTTTISGGTVIAASTNAFTTTGGVTFSGTTGTSTLDIQTDGNDIAYPINFGSTAIGSTLASDVKTGSVGINHTLGALTTGNATLNVVKGLNVASGSPSITLGTVGVNAGVAGTTIMNPTTASLSLGAVSIALNNSAKTLQLDGTNANNSVTGVIANGLNTLSVLKANSSTWTLSGANTYTGSTVARGGTLNLSGSAKTGGITSGIYVVDNNAASTTNARVNISCDVNAVQMFIGDRSGSTPVQVGAVFQTAGTLTLSQASSVDNLRLGSVAGGQGYYSLSGGSVSGNELSIGGSLNGTIGVMDITGGTMTTPGWLTVARGGTTSSGILNVSGTGAVNLTGTLDNTRRFRLNWAGTAGAQSVVTVSGGGSITGPTSGVSLSTYTLDLSGANVAGTLGAVNLLTGGTIQIFGVTGGNALPTSLLNFNGGTLKATTTNANFITDSTITGVYVYANGATIDDNGTPISVSRPLLAPTGNGVNGITSFTGGAGYVGAPMVTVNRGSGDVTGTGATAIAQIDSSTGGATSGQVTNVVITNPGFNYTVTPTFTLSSGGAATAATITGAAPTANTSGGLTKKGSGTLTLTGTNTYTGSTVVSAGTLAVFSWLTTTGAITVNDGAIFSVFVAGTNQLSAASLTLGNTTGGTNAFSGLTSTTLAPVSTAALTLNGISAINIVNVPGIGIYPLIAVPSVANITGAGSLVIGSLPRGVTATIITNGNTLAVNVTGFSQNFWTGSVNTNWDITATANWKTNGTAANYVDGDLVVFDDSSSVNSINVSNVVSPGSMTFSNSTQNYTFTNGIIAGSGSLIKNGAGSLSLSNANTYTGSTVLNAGTLLLGGASPLGVGGTVTMNGGTVQFNAPTIPNNLVVPTGATVSWVKNISGPTLSGNISGGGTINESGNVGGFGLNGNNSGFTGVMNSGNNGGSHRWRFNNANAGSAAAAWSLNTVATDAYGFNFGTGTIFFGSLSGSGTFRNDLAGTVTLSVGALNTDATFSGTIVGNGTSILALTKTGTGTLTLTGGNTFTGATTISGGRLSINTATLTGNGAMIINDAGRLNLRIGSSSQMTLTSLALGSVNGCTNEFVAPASTTTAPIFATTLTLAGTNVINIVGGGYVAGNIYPLIGYTTINGAGSFQIGTVPAGLVATITTNNISGVNTIALNVSAASTTVDVWSGKTSGNWDLTTAGNWTNSGAAVLYADGDNVRLDDSATAFTVTTVSASLGYVSPGNMVVSNTANNYTINGVPIVQGGTLTKNGTGTLTFNTVNTGNGAINLNAGTLSMGSASSLGLGTLTMSNGTTWLLTSSGNVFPNNPIVLAGGSAVTISTTALGNGIGGTVTGDSASTITISGSVSFSATTTQLDPFLGTVNVPSGTTLRFSATSGTDGSTNATFIVNGTLQPRNAGQAWMLGALSGSGNIGPNQTVAGTGTTTYHVGTNNASTTFSGKFLDFGASAGTTTNAAVTKWGTGTFTVSGNSAHSGTTTVNKGALIGVAGSSFSNSPVTINTGATNGVIVNTAGAQWVCTNLTYAAGTETAVFTFNTISPSTTVAPLLVQNNLTISGTLNVQVGGYTLPLGTYPLIKYTNTLTGAPVLAPIALPQRDLGYVTNDTANKQFSLVITNVTSYSEPLVWQPGSGLWDTTTASWKDQLGVTTSYSDLIDAVVFNETPAGSGPFAVTNNSSFSPVSVTVSNVTKQYTMSGSGIIGTAPLTKNGSGTLVLVNSNSFTGITTINAGTIQLGDGVANNGYLSGNITNNGTLVFAGPANQTYVGVISGTGSVIKTNASTLSLTNANTYSGGTAINAGTVSINLTGGLGTGTVTLGNASGAAATVAVNGLTGPNAANLSNAVTVAGTGLNTISGIWNSSGQINLLPGAITLSSASLTINATAASGWRIQGGVTGTGNLTFQDNFTGAGAVIDIRSMLNNVGTITNSGTGNVALTVNGSQSGQIGANVTSLIQNSSASQFLINAADSSFLGTVQVLLGTMALQNANALNTNLASIASGATLDIQNVNQTLAGLNDVSGAGGTVNDTTGSSLHTLTLGGGGIYSFSGSITAVTNANRALTVNLTGNGIQTLSGNSTFAGGTTISGGILRLGSANALGTGGTAVNGGTLDVNGLTNSTVTSVTGTGAGGIGALINSNVLNAALLSSEIVNGAGFTVGGPGSLTLQRVRSGGAPIILTKIGDGTLTIGNANATNHNNLLALDVESASTVNLGMTTYIALDRGVKINAGGTVRYTGSSGNMLSDGPQVLVLNGTLDMNGHSDTAGQLTIGNGTNNGIVLGGSGSIYTVAANYSLFGVNGNVGTGTIEAMSGSADVILAGSGIPLNKTSTNLVILSQANTYSGNTTISAGTLLLTNAGAIGSTPNIAVASGALFDVSGVTGSFTLGAAQTLSGFGSVNGTLTNNGTIAPGASIGTLTLSNSPALNGTVVMELNRTNAQNADQLVLTAGTLNYGGALIVTNLGDALQSGDTFTLFAAGAYSGAFTNIVLPSLPVGLDWNTNTLAVNGSLAVVTTISPTALALTSSANPSGYLDALTFTATLAPTNATGNVTFYNGATPFGTNTLTLGVATSASLGTLPRGTNTITAIYGGDINDYGSTNTLAQVVTNHPPVAGSLNYSLGSGVVSLRISVSSLLGNVTDADSDTISLVSVGASTNGVTPVVSGGLVQYYSTNGVSDQFTFTVTDGFGGTNSGSISITVTNVFVGQVTGQFTSFSNNVVNLTFHGIPDYSYVTQRSTNLTTWVDVLTNTAATNGVINVTDSFSDLGSNAPASAYYRLKY